MLIKFLSFFLVFFLLPFPIFANEGVFEFEKSTPEQKLETTENTQQEKLKFTTKVVFQNPSYVLEKDENDREFYTCDDEKEECKINLKFLGILNNEELTSAKYSCETTFGFESEEENKCNPKTIIFPKGEHTVTYKIILKSNENTFEEGSFTIKNIQAFVESEKDSESESGLEGQTEKENDQNSSGSSETNGESQDENSENSDENSKGDETDTQNDEVTEKGEGNEESEGSKDGEHEKKEFPELQIKIQSGANFSSDNKTDILCPEEGTGICKINLLVEHANTCEFDFGLEEKTGYEENCNPGYIDFPIGDTHIRLKNGDEVKKYTVKNSLVERDFSLQLSTQTPNYLLETEEVDSFTCDRSKEICKVNFDLRESFGEESATKFSCLHHFSFGETGEEKKCNPNTIEIPLGEHTLEFHMTSGAITKVKTITIKNEGYKEQSSAKNSTSASKTIKKRPLPRNEIEVQSGLDEQHVCDKKECRVNFKYDDDRDDIACKWDFGEVEYKKTIAKKCNPGYVAFLPGTHTVSVKVYQEDRKSNFFIKTFTFTNIYQKTPLESKIELQGKLAKYKKYFVNRVFCTGVESCSLNFDGSKSLGEIEKYHWDFGNGEIFEGKNPKKVEFFPGEYEVKLTVSDEQDNKDITTFFVKVSEKEHTDEEIQSYIFELFPTMFHFKNTFVKWYNGLYFFENMKLFEEAQAEQQEKLKLSLRKNKNSATVYGKAEPGAVVIISEKVDILFWKGLFVKNQYEVEADEKGKFTQKIVCDEQGNFTVGAVQSDEKLGNIDFPKEKYFSVTEVGKDTETNTQQEKDIFKPVVIDVELQGKVGKNKIVEGNNITCLGTCSINLKSNSIGSIASEHWDFGNGEKSEKKNPKSVKYEQFGNYIITYAVTDTNGEVFTEKFSVKFIQKPKKTRKKKSKKRKVGPVKLEIEVQGKIGKSKKLEPGKLTCYGTCKVNFDGRKSSGAYKQLIWDFGNGESFQGENPKNVTYKQQGKYTVNLKAQGYDGKWYTQSFLVVFGEQEVGAPGLKSLQEEKSEPEIIENMLVEKRQYTKLDIFYLSLIFSITMGGGGLSFWRMRK